MERKDCSIELSREWQILGPFQIGTREATWGADPLEYRGGFRSLEYDTEATFHSSIGSNGTVGWKTLSTEAASKSMCHDRAHIKIRFPEIDWAALQSVFGWSALQYQGWARGEIVVNGNSTKTIVLYTDQILELWLDDELHFGGDFYAFRRAPLVVRLEPGSHRLDLRLIREVRSMGGIGKPDIDLNVEARVSSEVLHVDVEKILLPELVNGTLTSKFASIPVRNDDRSWVYIKSIEVTSPHSSSSSRQGTSPNYLFPIAPGQSRPLACELVASDVLNNTVSFVIKYFIGGDHRIQELVTISQFSVRDIHEPQRLTFKSTGGAVSYAILRPPPFHLSSVDLKKSLPILINLHGAGLDADSEQVRYTLDAVPNLPAWVIFPTGGSLWSGDDWHTIGFSDVQAAIAAIPDWIHAIGWTGPGVNVTEILFSGHSNGGQGTWFAASHHPDLTIAAAPVSGYSSIQTYVSYNLWHEMDPKVASILGTSLLSYRHELLVSNFAGIPILQQHGSVDDNVPVFNSRRLRQLISQNNGSSNYVELEGKGHWFDGVMTSDPLRKFYVSALETRTIQASLPTRFEFVVPSSGDLGSKGGIHVDQLITPDRLGHIKVSRFEDDSTWTLTTSNIFRFHFSSLESRQSRPMHIVVDSQAPLPVSARTEQGSQYFVRHKNGSWATLANDGWKQIGQRRGAQLGALDAFLRTNRRFRIEAYRLQTLKIPLQISRSLFQYFGADTEVAIFKEGDADSHGNIVHVSVGFPALPVIPLAFPIDIQPDKGIIIKDAKGQTMNYPLEAGLGAILLTPLPNERLSLVVWGIDPAGLEQVARLIPALTGTGQPDFVVCNRECAYKGAAGVMAAGFFDYRWAISDASYLT